MDDLFTDSKKELTFAPSKRESLGSKLDRQEIDTPYGSSMDSLFEQRVSAQSRYRPEPSKISQSNTVGESRQKPLPAILSMLSSVLGNSADNIQAPVTQRVDITQYPNKQN